LAIKTIICVSVADDVLKFAIKMALFIISTAHKTVIVTDVALLENDSFIDQLLNLINAYSLRFNWLCKVDVVFQM